MAFIILYIKLTFKTINVKYFITFESVLTFKTYIMRKNYISIFILLFSTFGINAQIATFPWTETFEDSSTTRAAWTQIYEVNIMAWTFASSPSTGGSVGTSTAYEGVKFANYPATSHLFDKTKLVSPVLDLSGYSSPSVSFYFRNPYWNPDQNWLRVFYRISATDPWVQLAEFHSNVINWTSTGPISFPSTTYQIAVECETDYGYSTTVDALTISATVLSNDEFSRKSISYYPNPTQNILNYSSNEIISDIIIFNVLGQKVMETKVNSTQGQIDISTLASGNYVVRGNTEAGPQVYKIVKK